MKHLVVGGEGYIGQKLVSDLININKDAVISFDCRIYKQKKNSNIYNKKLYRLINDKMSNFKKYSNILSSIDSLIILGGLVGDPITKKYSKVSKKINEDDIMNIMKISSKYKVPKIIFISTCSNYGLVNETEFATEKHRLKPLSLYAKSKVKCEKYLFKLKFNTPVILRFATAFGLSDRMRFDLTVNEFTRDLYYKKKLDIYDQKSWRPYCHVNDFSRIIRKVLIAEKKKVAYQIFNVGNNRNNCTKKNLVDKIVRILKYKNNRINYLNKGFDRRNYKVDFSKIEKVLKIKTKFDINYGIKEILLSFKKNRNYFKNKKLGNYNIKI
jgi:nucleoside-diphosphate-sugar epimerase